MGDAVPLSLALTLHCGRFQSPPLLSSPILPILSPSCQVAPIRCGPNHYCLSHPSSSIPRQSPPRTAYAASPVPSVPFQRFPFDAIPRLPVQSIAFESDLRRATPGRSYPFLPIQSPPNRTHPLRSDPFPCCLSIPFLAIEAMLAKRETFLKSHFFPGAIRRGQRKIQRSRKDSKSAPR